MKEIDFWFSICNPISNFDEELFWGDDRLEDAVKWALS
jgi:hypothetical protein